MTSDLYIYRAADVSVTLHGHREASRRGRADRPLPVAKAFDIVAADFLELAERLGR